MKTKLRPGPRQFQVEVWYYNNSYYIERIAQLERVLAKKPRALQLEIVGMGEIPADVALRFRAALMERSPRTRILTNARSSLRGSSVLLWLLGESRTIRDDARIYFRRTTLSEDDEVPVNGAAKKEEPKYRDSYSEIDPDEGDYARVLQLIDEFLPVKEMAGRLIGLPVLRQFGLIENEKMDDYLASIFSKKTDAKEHTQTPLASARIPRRQKAAARVTRR